MTAQWFKNTPVIGKLPPGDVSRILHEAGETDLAKTIDAQIALESTEHHEKDIAFRGVSDWWPFSDQPWQHTAHSFGYVSLSAVADQEHADIVSATQIEPDTSLVDSQIKITLSGIRAAGYPGGGRHRVLLDFYAQNQSATETEHLHFNSTFSIQEGEHAAILGFPIFTGLRISNTGVAFKCFVVNVRNESDETFLKFLEDDAFRAGLKLTGELQPNLSLFARMAYNITLGIAKRNRNIPVQEFYLGLDFDQTGITARIAEGTYIAVQIPETNQMIWDWKNWIFDKSSGRIVSRSNGKDLVPYNCIIFTVSRYKA